MKPRGEFRKGLSRVHRVRLLPEGQSALIEGITHVEFGQEPGFAKVHRQDGSHTLQGLWEMWPVLGIDQVRLKLEEVCAPAQLSLRDMRLHMTTGVIGQLCLSLFEKLHS
jgi:hypothetical protein